MSGAGSTEPGPLVRAAARGDLPDWAVAGDERRSHMARVAALMGDWAAALELPESDRIRWAAAGWLHDVLRDADPGELRATVPESLRDLPDPLLHGPAAAERLTGHADAELLDAIRYHTVGHPSLDRLGRALYLADFLDPERPFEREWRASLREEMPGRMEEIVVEVLAQRLGHQLSALRPIRRETTEFWSSLVGADR